LQARDPGDQQTQEAGDIWSDLHAQLHRIAGVDLTQIDRINVQTAQTVISEVGVVGKAPGRGTKAGRGTAMSALLKY
jgi:hypothetical protein